MTVISPPIPPFQNLPINAQFYQPSQFFISAIAQGVTTIVTTTEDTNYVIGQTVRLIIPMQSGIRGLNGQQGYVIAIPAPNQVEITINSVGLDPFTTSTARQQPQILAIGDVNTGPINANGPRNTIPYVPGSFIDISPA
jgi:hypothetical protein